MQWWWSHLDALPKMCVHAYILATEHACLILALFVNITSKISYLRQAMRGLRRFLTSLFLYARTISFNFFFFSNFSFCPTLSIFSFVQLYFCPISFIFLYLQLFILSNFIQFLFCPLLSIFFYFCPFVLFSNFVQFLRFENLV